jgi:signal transduction histidine kinase
VSVAAAAAPADRADDSAIADRLTALLFRNARLAQSVSIVVSGLVAVLGFVTRPGPVILAWWAAMIGVSLLRLGQAGRYARRDPAVADQSRWRSEYVATTVATSLLWLVGGTAVMWHNADPYRLLAGLAMAGMVAGAVPVLGAVKEVFRWYAIPMLVGVALVNFLDEPALVHWVFGGLSLVFLAGALRSANFLNEVLVDAMSLDLEKSRMVGSLEVARQGAESANIAKTQFLATMSHELRTPLTGMLGMAELLCEGEVTESERKEYAAIILSSGKSLLALLNDILDLSKVEAGKMEIGLADFHPAQLLDELGTLFGETARRKGVAIRIAWHAEPTAHYVSDPFRVRQMLTNLIANAVKFTDQGSILIEGREIGRKGVVAELEFSVTDTGMGIAPEKIDLLFRPFSQVDNSNARKSSGTGLGLSIVRRIAQLMDGDAGVTSEPGKGSRFWIRLRATRMG